MCGHIRVYGRDSFMLREQALTKEDTSQRNRAAQGGHGHRAMSHSGRQGRGGGQGLITYVLDQFVGRQDDGAGWGGLGGASAPAAEERRQALLPSDAAQALQQRPRSRRTGSQLRARLEHVEGGGDGARQPPRHGSRCAHAGGSSLRGVQAGRQEGWMPHPAFESIRRGRQRQERGI